MAYVMNSWAKASWSHLQSELFLAKRGEVPPYYVYQRLFVEAQKRLVDKGFVNIACDDEEPSTILGYLVGDKADKIPVLHYVQVKRDLMRKGIASTLLEHSGFSKDSTAIYTFTSPIQGKVKTPVSWVYVPWYLAK